MFHPRVIAVALLACSALMAAGTNSAFALPDSSSPSATAVAHVDAAPALIAGPVSAVATAQAAKLLGIDPPRQVAFVPVCYYVYRYMYYCAGGRCAYVYRYVYACN